METAEGAALYESNALAYYIAAANKAELVGGSDALTAAMIQQFIGVADNEVVRTVSAWVYPLLATLLMMLLLSRLPSLKPTRFWLSWTRS